MSDVDPVTGQGHAEGQRRCGRPARVRDPVGEDQPDPQAGLMTTTCPAGHESATTDYCDECGARDGRDRLISARRPSCRLEPVTAPTPSTGETCPICGTTRVGRDQFCEECGYDFVARPAARRRRECVVGSDVGDRRHCRPGVLRLARRRGHPLPVRGLAAAIHTRRAGDQGGAPPRVAQHHAGDRPLGQIPRTTGSPISTSSSCAPTTARTP